jgi:hypothetical protein
MTAATEKPEWLMARIEIGSDDWAAVRVIALKRGVTTQQLIGDTLRSLIEQEAAK